MANHPPLLLLLPHGESVLGQSFWQGRLESTVWLKCERCRGKGFALSEQRLPLNGQAGMARAVLKWLDSLRIRLDYICCRAINALCTHIT